MYPHRILFPKQSVVNDIAVFFVFILPCTLHNTHYVHTTQRTKRGIVSLRFKGSYNSLKQCLTVVSYIYGVKHHTFDSEGNEEQLFDQIILCGLYYYNGRNSDPFTYLFWYRPNCRQTLAGISGKKLNRNNISCIYSVWWR